MGRARYVAEGMPQLSDEGVYVKLDKDSTDDRARSDGYISDSILGYLLVNSTAKAGRFYLLPKLHKKGCTGSPLISGCNTPTTRISESVDYHLKPMVPSIPSF